MNNNRLIVNGINYFFEVSFNNDMARYCLSIYDYSSNVVLTRVNTGVQLIEETGEQAWKSAVVLTDTLDVGQEQEEKEYSIIYEDYKLYFIDEKGIRSETIEIETNNQQYTYYITDFDDNSKTVNIAKYESSYTQGSPVEISTQKECETLFVQHQNLNNNVDTFIYKIDVTGVCFEVDKAPITSISKLYYKQDAYEIANNELKLNGEDVFSEKDGKYLENTGSDSIVVKDFEGNGYAQDLNSLVIYENNTEVDYELILNYRSFNYEKTVQNIKDNEGNSFTPDNLSLEGHILEKDINLHTPNNGLSIDLDKIFNGNDYIINYYSGESLFSSMQAVYNLNIGGVVYVDEDEVSCAMLTTTAKDILSNVTTYGSISTMKNIFVDLNIAGVTVNMQGDSMTNVSSHVNISSWSDSYGEDIYYNKTGDPIFEGNKSKFSGVALEYSDTAKTDSKYLTNFGTIIGYDGQNGLDGYTSYFVGDSSDPTSGQDGQNVNSIGFESWTNTNVGYVRGGQGGVGGKGQDFANGMDSLRGNNTKGTQLPTDGSTTEIISQAPGEKGVDLDKPEDSILLVPTLDAKVSTYGCTSWYGLNLKGYGLKGYSLNSTGEDVNISTSTKWNLETVAFNADITDGHVWGWKFDDVHIEATINLSYTAYDTDGKYDYIHIKSNSSKDFGTIEVKENHLEISGKRDGNLDGKNLIYTISDVTLFINTYSAHSDSTFIHDYVRMRFSGAYFYVTEDILGVNGSVKTYTDSQGGPVEETQDYIYDNEGWRVIRGEPSNEIKEFFKQENEKYITEASDSDDFIYYSAMEIDIGVNKYWIVHQYLYVRQTQKWNYLMYKLGENGMPIGDPIVEKRSTTNNSEEFLNMIKELNGDWKTDDGSYVIIDEEESSLSHTIEGIFKGKLCWTKRTPNTLVGNSLDYYVMIATNSTLVDAE